MSDDGWIEITRWSKTIDGICLSVGPSAGGDGWRWSVNRYPDIHKTGETNSKLHAMASAEAAALVET